MKLKERVGIFLFPMRFAPCLCTLTRLPGSNSGGGLGEITLKKDDLNKPLMTGSCRGGGGPTDISHNTAHTHSSHSDLGGLWNSHTSLVNLKPRGGVYVVVKLAFLLLRLTRRPPSAGEGRTEIAVCSLCERSLLWGSGCRDAVRQGHGSFPLLTSAQMVSKKAVGHTTL